MEIHDLNTGTPSSSDYLAMDTGSDSYKTTIDALLGKATVESASYTYAGVVFYFRKFGRICIVTSNSACNVAIPTNAYADGQMSFDAKFKPGAQVISRQMQDSNGNSVSVNIDSNATLRMGYAGTQISSGTLIRINLCYITAS